MIDRRLSAEVGFLATAGVCSYTDSAGPGPGLSGLLYCTRRRAAGIP